MNPVIKLLKSFAKTIERLNEHEKGIMEGDQCNRDFCLGTIQKEGSCSCPTGNPPCWYCTDAPHYCDTCGWEEER